jgi:hypothetical protein
LQRIGAAKLQMLECADLVRSHRDQYLNASDADSFTESASRGHKFPDCRHRAL